MNHKSTRRRLLASIAAVFGPAGAIGAVRAAMSTPRTTEGPFYPRPSMRMPDNDNDLVKVRGVLERAGGEVFTLRGTVSDQTGKPLAGHRVEIWQCDVNGKYLHTGDNRNVAYDSAFQGFGQDTTDDTGGYVFRTIKPTIYPGRTPHIHVKVFDGETELLTTQLYIKGHANNPSDGLFRRMPEAQADAVSMAFVDTDDDPEATVHIVV